MFPLPKGKPEFSKLEESILQYWKENKTFEKSVESRTAENPYRFYDGPPFITGTPHYGSLLSSIIKDVVPRYQTMLGKRVERVWGWDCHGLPIEQKVQKKLGLESNKEIEESAGGIQGFIDECYAYTRDTSAEWSWYIDHIGRWVDMDGAYRTMDQNYMESVMWVFGQIWEKGYIYEGKRVSWYSWKLSTPISNFEIAMDDSYQDVQDPAITVKFPIKEIKKGAGAIVRDEAGKLLMIRNTKDGLWRVPGGHVEKDESYHDAAARELLEETGITCKLEPMYNFYHTYRGAFYYAERFTGTVPVGHKVVLEEGKYSDYEYFSLDTLPLNSEIHPVDMELIEYLTGVREIVPVSGPAPVSFLAWTTTPWTMPMHMALAVNNDITYAQVLSEGEIFILAQSRVETVFKGKGDYQIIGTMRGEELVGLHYQAPFDFYQKKPLQNPLDINEKQGGKFEYTSEGRLRYVLGVIKNEKGEVLMLQNIKHDLRWQCPGGKIDKGETPEEALQRELMEELGVEVKIGQKLGDYHCQTGSGAYWQGEYYEVTYTGKLEIKEPQKHAQMQWTSIVPDSTKSTGFHLDFESEEQLIDDNILPEIYDANALFTFSKGETNVAHGPDMSKSFIVYHADFVTDTDGTGIAHEAPEFGDVDFQLAKQEGIHITSAIDEAGKYTAEIPDYQGTLYLDAIDTITERLKTEGTLFKKEGITHRVPYCPRSNTPLIQKAQKSWFIDIQRIKSELIEQNESINWFPDHFKHGRFLKSLESAPDWCISRSRFWGTPMPVWQDADGSERVVISSREELYQKNKSLGQITKFIFVRHGQSEANLTKINGTSETPLTELGLQQAEGIVSTLKDEKIDVVVVSPYKRAIQTATPLVQALGLEMILDDRVKERDHGSFTGQPVRSEEEAKLALENYDHKFGGGESIHDMMIRGEDFVKDMMNKYPGKTIAIVSHQRFGRALFEKLTGRNYVLDDRLRFANCSLHTLYLDHNTGKELNLHRPYIDRIYVPAEKHTAEKQDKKDTTKFIFVRHGESVKNVEKVTDGTDKPRFPLTEKGRKEAQNTADVLKSEKIDAIFSSPFARTQETADILNQYHNLTVQCDERLRECFRGKFDGQAKENRSDEYYADMELYYSAREYKVGGGDSVSDICDRMLSFIRDISEKNPGKTIVVVSHGDPLAIVLDALMDKSYFGKDVPLPPTGQPITLLLDNKTGKEFKPQSETSFTPKKVLGVHGWTSRGLGSAYEGKWLPLQDKLKAVNIQFDVPDFDKNKETSYAKWRDQLDALDVASYDTIMATSFGCPVIMQYLGEKNISLKRLVLVAPSGLVGNEHLEKIIPEMTEDVEKLRGLVDEIIIPHSEDDDSTSARFEYGRSLAKRIGATFLPINGVQHKFGGWSIDFLSSLIQHGAPLRRIPEVLDVWMDSASMPYAQVHYPFENQEKMEASFPADFIAEYTGQIRAWFYVMHAIGVMVKGSPAFKNVAVTGVINGTDGRKMSKSFGNYPDPRETIEKYGADAIRFYLMGGTLMKGEDMTFSEAGIQESIKRVLLPLWNSYTFFATYANIDGWEFTDYSTKKTHELDTWIISRLHTLIEDVRTSMDAYDLQKTCDAIMVFLDGLNNWYIRRNRRRFWRSELDADKKSAYETLHEVLVTMTKLLAPICPFITEHLYQNLMNTTESVHLCDFPAVNQKLINLEVNQKMTDLQNLTNLGLAIRGREKLRVRQPLRAATITIDLDESARETLAEELNVKEVHTVKDVSEYVTITYSPDAKKIGATERKQWMKTIIADAKAGKGTLTTEGILELTIPEAPGGTVILVADEFEAVYTPREGSTIAFAGSAGYVIGLDTTLDEELTLEGYARDMIRGIQDARKELGFEVTDRLQLSLTSENDMLEKILTTHQGMIEKETLTTIERTSHLENTKEIEIDEDFVVKLTLIK